MSPEVIAYLIPAILYVGTIAFIVIGSKYNIPTKNVENAIETIDNVTETINKYEFIFKMAKKFVILAKNDYESLSGKEKREWVIDKLQDICNSLNIVIPEVELEAINEDAYNEMKNESKE